MKKLKDPVWGFFFKKDNSDTKRILELLSKTSLFEGFKKSQLKQIQRIMHLRSFKPGETVVRENDPGIGMYIVWKGSVSVYVQEEDQESENKVASYNYGEFFGDAALFSDAKRTATVRATEEATLLGFCKPDLLELIRRNPHLGSEILIRILGLAGKRLQIANAHLKKLKKRVEDLEEAPTKSDSESEDPISLESVAHKKMDAA